MLLIKLSGVLSSRSAKMEKAERSGRRTIVVIVVGGPFLYFLNIVCISSYMVFHDGFLISVLGKGILHCNTASCFPRSIWWIAALRRGSSCTGEWNYDIMNLFYLYKMYRFRRPVEYCSRFVIVRDRGHVVHANKTSKCQQCHLLSSNTL